MSFAILSFSSSAVKLSNVKPICFLGLFIFRGDGMASSMFSDRPAKRIPDALASPCVRRLRGVFFGVGSMPAGKFVCAELSRRSSESPASSASSSSLCFRIPMASYDCFKRSLSDLALLNPARRSSGGELIGDNGGENGWRVDLAKPGVRVAEVALILLVLLTLTPLRDSMASWRQSVGLNEADKAALVRCAATRLDRRGEKELEGSKRGP